MHRRRSLLLVCSLGLLAACGPRPTYDRHTAAGGGGGGGGGGGAAPALPCTLDHSASGQVTATTGSVRGVVCDVKTGERLAGVTITAVSPALKGVQTAISDENGSYEIGSLPPGAYTLTFYFLETTVERQVSVLAAKATPVVQKLDQGQSHGEVIAIRDSAPIIDPSSTRQGITIDQNYTRNIPTGRTLSTGSPQPAQIAGNPPPPEAQPVEAYDRIDDNPFLRVDNRPLSTFSIDVDTAAYANTRRFLRDGKLPPKDAVRIEELVNYFRYAYPLPAANLPFTITTEVGPSPWNAAFKLVRVGLQTKPIADANVPARNLVFLLDVSGSMDEPNKLPLLKMAMGLLVDNLRKQDRITIVVYAGASGLALPPTRGDDKVTIRSALASLEPGGSTNGGAGIKLAYELARRNFIKGGINRVVLCTDGDFNVGVTGDGELSRLIEGERDHGVFLTVLGFGMGNLKDATMEKLADRGNGNYGYIDSIDEARKLLVKEAGATLVTVAKDVKLQVEMNPARVAGYRLIGYENRLLQDEDFANDKKDAGELGAGHSVTALYEIVPAGVAVPTGKVDKLKYQTVAPTPASASAELMTIKVRYKAPDADVSKLVSHAVIDRTVALAATSTDFRWASAVAGYGMLLRDAPEHGALTWAMVTSLAQNAVGGDPEGYRKELVSLIGVAAKLKP